MYKKAKIGFKAVINENLTTAQRRYISEDLRKSILDRDGYKCVKCGKNQALDIDHAVPICVGGKSTEDNLQVLCRDCNSSKGARTWWGPTLLNKALESGKTLEFINALYKQQRFK